MYARMAAERFAPLDRAIRDGPNDSQRYLDRAWAFVNFGKLNFAIADYTQALGIDANNAKAYIARAEAYRDRGEYDRALADCNEAVRVKPSEFEGYDLRGFLFEKKGKRNEAVADYRRALSLEPRAVQATDGLRRLGACGACRSGSPVFIRSRSIAGVATQRETETGRDLPRSGAALRPT